VFTKPLLYQVSYAGVPSIVARAARCYRRASFTSIDRCGVAQPGNYLTTCRCDGRLRGDSPIRGAMSSSRGAVLDASAATGSSGAVNEKP
jgi:hypothetical protein